MPTALPEPRNKMRRGTLSGVRVGRRKGEPRGQGAALPENPQTPELGWRLARLPRAAVLAAREARLPATLLGRYPEALVQLGVAGSRLTPEDLAGYRALGRAAAESGAALPSLVDLYLGVTWRVWDELPDAPGGQVAGPDGSAALRSAALAVMRAADDAVAALCAGYQEARQAVARAEESLRREFVDDLLTGTSLAGHLLTRATALGLHLEAPHAVLVVRGAGVFREGRGVARAVEARMRELLAPGSGALGGGYLVTTRVGLLVTVVPVPGLGDGDDGRDRVEAAVAAISAQLGSSTPERPWRLAVSRIRAGPAGVRAGFEEGRRLIEVADRLDAASPVVRAGDLLVYDVLLRDVEGMGELIHAALGPLRGARGGGQPLLDALQAWFAAGTTSAVAAQRLHLSVRAFTYRLARVKELTGLDPADPHARFTLQTAVLAQRVLGWPDEPAARAER
jgi:sugar diacid utilization regulator